MEKRGHSVLSILAFVFSLTIILAPLGLLFAIIDLVTRNPAKRHGFSIPAIVIGGIVTLIIVISVVSSVKDKKEKTDAYNAYIAEYSDAWETKKTDPPKADTENPDASYTSEATVEPVSVPTASPTPKPTAAPTATPTPKPTAAPTATPTPKPTAAPTKAPDKDRYVVGDTLYDDQVKIVYVASGVYKESNIYLQPKEGMKYIFLKFSFTNEGKSDESVSVYSFDAYADGYACEAYFGGEDMLSGSISSGRTITGCIYFSVPTDAKEVEIEYKVYSLFSSKTIRFLYEGEKDSGYTPEASVTRKDNAYAVGSEIEGSGIRMIYLSCEPYKSNNMFVQPKTGYHYVTLTLEIENTGKSDKTVTIYSFNCYADGAVCDQVYIRDDLLSATISPGRKVKGTVTFEIPDHAQIVEVEYEDNFWTNGKIVLTVQ